jgi:cadmium resistance protein CadD (predicted permease)
VILWIGLVLFVSTNVDDVFVLLAFFSDPAFRPRQVVIGQYLGMTVLIGVSTIAALGTVIIPLDYVALLGVVPLALGLVKLVDLGRSKVPGADEQPGAARFSASKPLAVAAVTIANGSDNVGAYVPLFATRTKTEVAELVCCFLLLTGVWCIAAHRLVTHPRAGAPIRRYGRIALPFALLGLGIYILSSCEPLRAWLRGPHGG